MENICRLAVNSHPRSQFRSLGASDMGRNVGHRVDIYWCVKTGFDSPTLLPGEFNPTI
jgi:hypothetical protein